MYNASSGLWIILVFYLYYITSITAPQDAHTRLVLQVYFGSNTLEFSAICTQVYCYLANTGKPEGFRGQGFVLPEIESLEIRVCGFLKKALPSREEPDISLSIVNSKARFYTNALHALLARSVVARWIHLAMILYVHILSVWPHVRGKIASLVAVRDEGCVAGEG